MRIVIVTGNHPKDAIGGSELQAYLIAQGLEDLGAEPLFCAVLSNRDIDTKEEDGLRYIALDRRRSVIKRAHRFLKIFNKYRPEVVYVRCLYSFWWIQLICWFKRIPTLYHNYSLVHCRYLTWRQYSLRPREKNWLRYVKKMIFNNFYIFNIKFADAIICQTQEQYELIKKNLHRTATLIPNAHPLPSSKPQKPAGTFNVIWVGKHWKNPDIFVDLAKRFRNKSEVRFTMVGIFPPPMAKEYEFIAKTLMNFRFVGALPYGEVNKLLEASHILVNTSDYEGFSNTFIQAWMRGVPVLSLNINPDGLLTEHKIGFHSGTVEQLEKDIERLYMDKGLYYEFSLNSYEYACREHDIRKTARKILELIENIG